MDSVETTFDVDGTVETSVFGPGHVPLVDGESALRVQSATSVQRLPQLSPVLIGRDAIPAIIELLDSSEDAFLSALIRDVRASHLPFKLAPVFVLYMAFRYRISPHYRTSLLPTERAQKLAQFLTKVANMLHVTIQDHCHDAESLCFWMANSSELLNLVKSDQDICMVTVPEPQESLADAVEKGFAHTTACLKQELNAAIHSILDPNLDNSSAANPCLHMLSDTMRLLRDCRINAALTIQLFSQLFHYINMYLFNWLVSKEGGAYCCRLWGRRLQSRLDHIQSWAFKQGLELAAECHLDRIVQALNLLQTPKTMEYLAPLGSTCYKLNSLQVRSLLERYRPDREEPPVSKEIIENVVKMAENHADDSLRSEGKPIQVEEETELELPFLLPEDGYSPDSIRGIPQGLQDFLDSLLARGLCRMILQPNSSGSWTVHMNGVASGAVDGEPSTSAPHRMGPGHQPEIAIIRFQKENQGIGLSIVCAQGVGQRATGIYVKKVVPGSAADKDGRLAAGDQLLKVNGHSLNGISQEEAASLMARTGEAVSFEVARQAALYNGLATWLYQSSPEAPHQPSFHRYQSEQQLADPRTRPPPPHQRMNSESLPPPPVVHSRSMSASNLKHEEAARIPLPQFMSRSHQEQQYYQNIYGAPSSPLSASVYPTRQAPPQAMNRSVEYRPSRPSHRPSSDYWNEDRHPLPVHHQDGGVFRAPVVSVRGRRSVPDSPASASLTPRHAAPSAFLFPSQTSPVADYQNLPLVARSHTHASPGAVQKPTHSLHRQQDATAIPRAHINDAVRSHPLVIQSNTEDNLGFHTQEPLRLSSELSPSREPRRTPSPLQSMAADPRLTPSYPYPVFDKNSPDILEVESEVVRLLKEEVEKLEAKEYLTEKEENRYQALKYELAYKTRLRQATEENGLEEPKAGGRNGRRMSDEVNLLTALSGFEPADPTPHVSASLSSPSYRQPSFSPKTRETPAVVHDLQDQMKKMSVREQTHESGRNGHVMTGRVEPPEVPPKRRVQFQEAAETPVPEPERHWAESPEPIRRYVYAEKETDTPRTQVLGSQEVYRDPRQERLNRLQTQKQQQIDGANLNFRDKMKLFARQIGDNSPRQGIKVSSAQRDIEKSLPVD